MTAKNVARAAPARASPAAVHPGPAPEEVTVAFTIVIGRQPLTKTFAVGDDGRPVKSRDAGLSAGSAARVVLQGTSTAIAAQLAAHLKGLTSNQALILAPPPP